MWDTIDMCSENLFGWTTVPVDMCVFVCNMSSTTTVDKSAKSANGNVDTQSVIIFKTVGFLQEWSHPAN